MKKIIVMTLISMLLSACSGLRPLNSRYDCPMAKGVNCKPLHEIDHDYQHSNELALWIAPQVSQQGIRQGGHWLIIPQESHNEN